MRTSILPFVYLPPNPEADLRYIDPETWVRVWKAAGPRLDAIRRRELSELNVADVVRSFDDAYRAAVRTIEPRVTSGLVEQQRLFTRLRG